MKKVLLYYSFSFAFGGGDPLPLSLVSALQDECRLVVAADVPENLERAADLFGIPVDTSKFELARLMAPGYTAVKHDALASFRRSRALKRLASRADVCISAANIMDFGRPGHHFVNMLAFGDDAFTAFVRGRLGQEPPPARPRPFGRALREAVLRPLLAMRAKSAIIRDPRERIHPNSRFVRSLMEEFYGPFGGDVFYPPTLFDPKPSGAGRDPLSVVCIGRIIPEKRVTDLVAIVEKARLLTGLALRFGVTGRLDQDPAYGRTLARMAETRPWLRFAGPLHGADKERFLLSGSWAVHGCTNEAFGIAVAEYLAAGLVPVVPDVGGAREVVDNPALAYRTVDEAASILARLLSDEAFRDGQRRRCAERAALFSKSAYLERQRALLDSILRAP